MNRKSTRRAVLCSLTGLLAGCSDYSAEDPDAEDETQTPSPPPETVPAVGDTTEITRDEVLRLQRLVVEETNAQREEMGLAPLTYHDGLSQVARYRGYDMWSRDYFGHDDPEGRYHPYYIKKFGYDCTIPSAENLFGGFYHPDKSLRENAQSMVESWMGSSAHRSAILNKEHNIIGVGVFVFNHDEGGTGAYALQLFCPEVSSTDE